MNDLVITPNWPAPSNITAISTLKLTPDNFFQNLPSSARWLNQVHGNTVVCADDLDDNLPDADASFTDKKNIICVIKTADCLPLLLCDKQGSRVAAIHAGWRSLSANIISKTIESMQLNPENVLAWLGPAISQKHFEVGHDVLDNFIANGWPNNVVMQNAAKKVNEQKFYLDLYSLARYSLQNSGVTVDNIYGGNWCTYSDPDKFYSYRRSKDIGRMSSLIWIK